VSERSCARAFRGEVGQTPAAYVEALRIDRARDLLEDGAACSKPSHRRPVCAEGRAWRLPCTSSSRVVRGRVAAWDDDDRMAAPRHARLGQRCFRPKAALPPLQGPYAPVKPGTAPASS
jgi:AraC-like DNA-binding protein